jgi:uncharacterized membrane protein
MVVFSELALIFAIGSLIGWVLELFYRRFAHGRWINPGFLVGPYVPLYGAGLVGLFLLCSIDYAFIPSPHLKNAFVVALITASMTLIEYFTGLVFIKGLKVKLWDYSNQWGNVQGIICPLFTFFWGAIGAFYYFVLHARIVGAIEFLANHIEFSFFVGIFFGIFAVDVVYSFRIVARITEWAKANGLTVKYEQFKLSIRLGGEKIKEKVRFLFSLGPIAKLGERLDEYKSQDKSQPKWVFMRKVKAQDTEDTAQKKETH